MLLKFKKVLYETKNDACVFTRTEFEILKEVVDVLEPAYDATLIMEEDSALISLVAPTVKTQEMVRDDCEVLRYPHRCFARVTEEEVSGASH